jgi:ATP-binding cassette, subfamily B, bacterial
MRQRPQAGLGEPDRRLRRTLGVITAGHRTRLVVLVGTSFIGGLVEAASLYLLAQTALALTKGHDEIGLPISDADASLGLVVLITAGLVALRFGFAVVVVALQARLFTDVLTNVRSETVARYLAASWPVQTIDRDGRLQELVGNFATQAAVQMSALTTLLSAACSAIALLVTAMWVNLVASLIVGLAGVGLLLVLRPLRAAAKRRSQLSSEAGMEYVTAVSEAASMAQEVHVFGVRMPIGRMLDQLGDRSRESILRTQRLAGMLPAIYQATALLVLVGSVGLVHASGTTQLGSLGAVVLIGVRSLSYGQTLQSSYQALHIGAPYVETLLTEQDRYAAAAARFGDRPLDRIDVVTFDDVSFTYDGKVAALDGVSFQAERGEIIGIVGPSGSGKSTLATLLPRFHDVTGGAVRIGGVDVRDIAPKRLYRLVGFVLQDVALVHGSVADNIRLGRPDASDDEIVTAARAARIHDRIAELPRGYDWVVGDDAAFSGGEAQRVAIARALLADAPLLVLDEATAFADPESEAAIQDALSELASGRTLLVIAHRLASIAGADAIVVLDDGAVVESGRHADLLAADGRYARMWRAHEPAGAEVSR